MVRFDKSAARVAVLTGILVLSACAPAVTAQGPATPAQQKGAFDPATPTAIALLAPLTASNTGAARLGQAIANSANIGLQDLNDPLVSLKIYDTAGDANVARQVAQRALDEGARLIVGPLFGQNASAIAPLAAARGIKVISFSTDSTVAGDPVYLSGFLPEMEARRITSFARGRGLDQIAIFYPQNVAGTLALRGAQTGSGPGLSVQAAFERSEAGIPLAARTFAASVLSSGTKAVLVPEGGQALAYIASTLAREGVTPQRYKFLGLGQWNAKATIESKQVVGGWFPAPEPSAVSGFVNRYRSLYGAVPSPLAALGYDAVQIAGQMLIEARTVGAKAPFSTEAVTRPQGFRGVYGPIRFDRNGLGERSVAILEVGEEVFSSVDPAPVVFDLGS